MSDSTISARAVPALAVDGLTYSYPNAARPNDPDCAFDHTIGGSTAQSPALNGVSLRLEAGELVVLAGRSASGKSTLLRAACGLIPHFHGGEIAGGVRVAGLDAIAAGPGELARVVGYVAQDPETQVVSTTVAAELELPLEMRGERPASRARAVEEVALALAMPHLLDRTVDTLSGGELQRVALAAALVTRPRLVLLDEPTSQLDPVAGDELIWLLRRLNEEWGVTVLLAEHRLERCLAAADRVVAMDSGSISFDGSPRDFLAWAQDADVALETPGARLFSLAGIEPLPVGVRDARQILDSTEGGTKGGRAPSSLNFFGGAEAAKPGRIGEKVQAVRGGPAPPSSSDSRPPGLPSRGNRRSREAGLQRQGSAQGKGGTPPPRHDPPANRPHAVEVRDLWVELSRGDEARDVLRGIDLRVERGERVALMGRNGAGKSTLLRTVAGLLAPVRGRVEAPDGVALLTQTPGDYLVRERVGDELPGEAGGAALRAVGLEHAVEADPRDLSGGERQRLALAIALAGRMEGEEPPGLVALDEPTRGMDRVRKDDLAGLIERLAARGAGVVVATHDVEFAAAFAQRVVLLGDGVVIADGAVTEVLSGGWYFATEVARVLDLPGVVTPEQGAEALRPTHDVALPAAMRRQVRHLNPGGS